MKQKGAQPPNVVVFFTDQQCWDTSGLYPTVTGCFTNGRALPRDTKTLAHHFHEAGYRTAYIGKWRLAGNTLGPVPEDDRGGYEY